MACFARGVYTLYGFRERRPACACVQIVTSIARLRECVLCKTTASLTGHHQHQRIQFQTSAQTRCPAYRLSGRAINKRNAHEDSCQALIVPYAWLNTAHVHGMYVLRHESRRTRGLLVAFHASHMAAPPRRDETAHMACGSAGMDCCTDSAHHVGTHNCAHCPLLAAVAVAVAADAGRSLRPC